MTFPTPGEEREFLLIDNLSVIAGWDGPNNPEKSMKGRANPAPGWVILETRVWVHSSNNGSMQTSVLVGGATIISKIEIEKFYNDKIAGALNTGDKDLAGRLEQTKQEHLKSYESFYTNKNLVEATVSARGHGNMFDRKRGWQNISVYAKCMYLGLPATNSLLLQPHSESRGIQNPQHISSNPASGSCKSNMPLTVQYHNNRKQPSIENDGQQKRIYCRL